MRLAQPILKSAITYTLICAMFWSCKKDEEAPSPGIIDFSPASAVIGATVTIQGSNFSSTVSANSVKFNGVEAIISNATNTSITTTVPLGATTGKISVSVNSKTATSSGDFIVLLPALSSFSPAYGPIGTTVTIAGSNFDPTPANNVVKFKGIAATVTNATTASLTVNVPAGASTGKISLSVNGTTSYSSTDFTILNPSITGFAPTSGVAGSSVTITGADFDANSLLNNKVKFNGVMAAVISSTSTQLVVTVPEAATTGSVSLTLGNVTATASGSFTILTPTITNFSPSIGSAGVSVVITGTNFSPNPAYNIVKFNGVTATVNNATATQITAVAPAGVTAGKINVTVGPNSATSASDFTICNGIELLLSNVTITSIAASRTSLNYSFDLTNVGSSAASLLYTNSTIQAYVSIDNVYDNSDLAASGWGIQTTINSAQTYSGALSSNISGGTVDNHPYLILMFSTTLAECNNTISHTIVKRIIP